MRKTNVRTHKRRCGNKVVNVVRHDRSLNPQQQKRLTAVQSTTDEHNVRELELYIDSDADLYRQQKTPIIKNLMKKKAKSTYNHDKAVLGFLNLVNNGARKYKKDIPNSDFSFSKADRIAVAKRLTSDFETEYAYGNYNNRNFT